jgi:hypothetical protein
MPPARGPYHCPDCQEVRAGGSEWEEYKNPATARSAGRYLACRLCFPKSGRPRPQRSAGWLLTCRCGWTTRLSSFRDARLMATDHEREPHAGPHTVVITAPPEG